MMDILPTLARLGGARVPSDRRIDGVGVWPVIAGLPDAPPPREVFHYFGGLWLAGVRSGPWKLRVNGTELYNLADDIGETKNIAAAHPAVVERLKALVQAMKDDLGGEDVGPGCRPLGRVANPQPLIAYDGTVRAGYAGERKQFP